MSTGRRHIWRKTRRTFALAAVALVNRLPRAVALRVGRLVGLLWWRFSRREVLRARLRAQAALGLTARESRTLVRRCALTLGGYLADAVRLERWRPRDLFHYIRLEGVEGLRSALAEGRGVLLLGAHVGNWELLAAAIGASGIPISVIGRRPDDPVLARRLHALRARWGVETIWREAGALPVVRALKAGRSVGVLIDQATAVRGTHVPFFGMAAHTATGPAAIALRMGLRVVPVHTADCADGTYVGRIEPAVIVQAGSEAVLTAQWTALVERWIRDAPHTWVWMHDRWRKDCDRRRRPAHTSTGRTGRHLALAAALAGVLATAGCEKLAPEPEAPIDSGMPSQRIEGTRIVWSEQGRTSAVISANTLRRFRRRDETHLEGDVRVLLYDEKGRQIAVVTGERGTLNDRARTASVDSGLTVRFLGTTNYAASTLTSDKAHADDRTKRVTATENVVVRSDSGVTLTTQLLVWNGRTRRFTAPGHVRLTNGTEVEEGEQLDANADLTEWTMKHIRGRSVRPAGELRRQENKVRRLGK